MVVHLTIEEYDYLINNLLKPYRKVTSIIKTYQILRRSNV